MRMRGRRSPVTDDPWLPDDHAYHDRKQLNTRATAANVNEIRFPAYNANYDGRHSGTV